MYDYKYHIRFNTKHNNNPNQAWRVFENGVEHLASNVKIFSPVYTECTQEHGETKWNVACNGRLIWEDTVAIIINEKD